MSQGNNYWSLNFVPFADVSYTLPSPGDSKIFWDFLTVVTKITGLNLTKWTPFQDVLYRQTRASLWAAQIDLAKLKPALTHHQKSIKPFILLCVRQFYEQNCSVLKKMGAHEMCRIAPLIMASADYKNTFVILLSRANCALFSSSRRFYRGGWGHYSLCKPPPLCLPLNRICSSPTRHRLIETIWTAHTRTTPVRKISVHSEYIENRPRDLDVTWQPVRGDLTARPWAVILPWG